MELALIAAIRKVRFSAAMGGGGMQNENRKDLSTLDFQPRIEMNENGYSANVYRRKTQYPHVFCLRLAAKKAAPSIDIT